MYRDNDRNNRGGERGHRHWPFCSQRTQLLCSTGLSYSLLTHIILNQFIQIKQTEAKKKEARGVEKEDKKRTPTAIETRDNDRDNRPTEFQTYYCVSLIFLKSLL